MNNETLKRVFDVAEWQELCPQDMEHLNHVLNDFTEEVRKHHPEIVEQMIFKAKMAVGLHFDEHSATYVVSKMKNADGSTGEHWDYETSRSVMKQRGYDFNCADWYYTLNMIYSDFFCADKEDDYYIKLAYQFLNDEDGPKGKAKKYYTAMNYCY